MTDCFLGPRKARHELFERYAVSALGLTTGHAKNGSLDILQTNEKEGYKVARSLHGSNVIRLRLERAVSFSCQ